MNPERSEPNVGERAPPDTPQSAQSGHHPDQETSSFAGELEADVTISAPSFPRQLASLELRLLAGAPTALDKGAVIGDFEIQHLLGRGAAGAVYLARQQSLDRRVALKVTSNIGSEARTMATLEHPHIVQVFSETVDAAGDTRLLCMQYVPGATLADVLGRIRKLPREQLSGTTLLAAIDELSGGELAFDAAALRDRERLAAADYVGAVCWIMARLAEALHFAHQRGVLHRDIKPANILINPYGRPLLADFSLSFASLSKRAAGDEVFGGTLAYMAPEHLDAFNSETATTSESVNQRSDIYSLGVVLYELLALKLPHETTTVVALSGQALKEMEQARRSHPAPLHTEYPEVPYALDYTTRRCLAGAPEQRYADAGQLAGALDGCRLLELARQHLPAAGPSTRAIARAPVVAIIALAFLPHLLGNLFTPAYNALILFPRFSEQQQMGLVWISAIYGAIVFPALITVVVVLYVPAARVWRRLKTDRPPPAEAVDRARRRLLTAPMAATWLSSLGWLPLLVFLPAGLHVVEAGINWREYAHVAVSVLLSLLIAATYSYFVLQYAMVRILYPEVWANPASFLTVSRAELAAVPLRLRWFQIGAGLVPLVGAILILALGPEAFEAGSYLAFRWLIFCLIVLGMAGMPLAIHVGSLISKSVDALTRPSPTGGAASPAVSL